jgi:hypothetical protein
LLADQDHCCAICRISDQEVAKKKHYGIPVRLAVDHDHVTGTVRGLLCNHCNLMIGHALDRQHILIAGADYLRTRVEDLALRVS